MTDGSGSPYDVDLRGSWVNQNNSVLWIDEQSEWIDQWPLLLRRKVVQQRALCTRFADA